MNKLIESELSTTDERTLLIAGIYNAISVMSIIFQFLLTRRILNWRVPLYGLLLIPLVQIAGSSAMLLKSSLFLGALVVVIRYALNYSVGRSVRELIYTPLSQPEKFEGKAFIDTLVFRTGDGSASLLLLVILHVLPVGSMVNGLILVGMIGSILIISKLNQRVQSQEERGEADTLPEGNR